MIAADLIRGAALVVTGCLVALDQISVWVLAALAFFLGSARVLFDCAATALLPCLVPSERLVTVNGHLTSGQLIGRDLIGQAIGGILYTTARAAPLLTDAATFLLSAAAIHRLPTIRSAIPQLGLAASIRDGLRHLRTDRTIRQLTTASAILNLAYTGQAAILVTFAHTTLHMSPSEYGFALAVGGAGGIAVGLPIGRGAEHRNRTTLLTSVALLGLAQLSIAAAPGPILLAVACLLCSAATALWNIASTALRQTVIPIELLGRTTGITRLLSWGIAPAGALTAGAFASTWGPRTTLVVIGAISLATFTMLAARLPTFPNATQTPKSEPALPARDASTKQPASPCPSRTRSRTL
ncbi:MFS transporter [Nocardia neocaledoniensis NBRC 108232]|uniref:Putative MFS family arabinose efflux permease n=2 Tax=Nocardia neocaledoniensis TaxID=236511 RepID=A0A317N5K3_9NOCA|nr:putative MFS family arabinose efflux permease [Nocardia neocaledoniensis]GEM30842.1 MFS transporter [Nocardia neocaledoniensis NBRC 108232]